MTQGMSGRYVTLSHRWGSSEQRPLVTTTENISSHRAGITPELLPATFRDAVEVTRALGFEYIWIDSLCIIQDSVDDWVTESANMADIYMLSSLTLAADFAEDSSAGLFHQDPLRMPKVRQFTHPDGDGNNHQIFVRKDWPYPGRGPVRPGNACYASEAISQLDTRGWVMQERLLSRRTVTFTNTELLWECCRLHVCSCAHEVGLYKPTGRESFESLCEVRTSGEFFACQWQWYEIVTQFAARQLTVPTDRLPALTGIAQKIPLPATDYLAGLWRTTLRTGLLWVNPLGCIKWRTTTGQESINWRMPDNYAPSWSWASISGPVDFSSLEDGGIEPSVMPWSIVAAGCTPRTTNAYGPVSGGFLDIEGYILPIAIRNTGGDVEQTSGRERLIPGVKQPVLVLTEGEDVGGFNNTVTWMDAGLAAREWEDQAHDYFLFHMRAGYRRTLPVGMILRRMRTVTQDCFSRIGIVRLDNWRDQDRWGGAEPRRFRIV
jgi:hypothetical protein